ncbi:MAG TPA: TIGR01841 family phasin [Burkholderiaceae bacterium]|nr:TIGR01841 family phasin [Burkholderiaceae bacterium]
MMNNTPEQFVQLQKSALDSFQAAALTSVEGLERLTELNIQVARASIDEATEAFKSILEAKDPKALVEFASTGAQPAAEKFAAYAKQAYDIAAATNTELAKLVERQFAESNKQLYATIDALAKNAPAGSEGAVALVKQAVNTANSAFDQVSKATKQVVELAEANIAAAAKNSPVRAAAKKAA